MKALILDCPNKSGNDIGESGNDIGEPGNDITWLKDLSPICQETFGYLLNKEICTSKKQSVSSFLWGEENGGTVMKKLIFSFTVLWIVLLASVSISHQEESRVSPGVKEYIETLDVDWWPMFRHDIQHTGNSTTLFAPTIISEIWRYRTGARIRSSPAIVDDKVYIGSDDGNLYCINVSDGQLIWEYDTGDYPITSSPTVMYGNVYFGTEWQRVYCLDAVNGTLIWKYNTHGKVSWSSPAVAENRVYIGTWNDDDLICLDALTGHLIWTYTTHGIESSPAFYQGKLYVG
jgi:hypothetical protein